jgi:hypothetical protein
MGRLGQHRFKKDRVKVFTEVCGTAIVRITREQIKGQKLRDRTETTERFVPIPVLAHIPGVWVGTWNPVK